MVAASSRHSRLTPDRAGCPAAGMPTLTRALLEDGSYVGSLGLPSDLMWTSEQLEESLACTLRAKPDGDIWVFAYGSLMWNPLLRFVARHNAVLGGWHRSFCLQAVAGRGSAASPGRMLALETGGQVNGVALRISEAMAPRELGLLWVREMAAGTYHPRWEQVVLQDGRQVTALVFVVNRQHALYASDASVGVVARLITLAAGSLGSNAEYVCCLGDALADAGLDDPYIDALVCELTAIARST